MLEPTWQETKDSKEAEPDSTRSSNLGLLNSPTNDQSLGCKHCLAVLPAVQRRVDSRGILANNPCSTITSKSVTVIGACQTCKLRLRAPDDQLLCRMSSGACGQTGTHRSRKQSAPKRSCLDSGEGTATALLSIKHRSSKHMHSQHSTFTCKYLMHSRDCCRSMIISHKTARSPPLLPCCAACL